TRTGVETYTIEQVGEVEHVTRFKRVLAASEEPSVPFLRALGPTPVPWTRGLFTLRARVYRSRRVRRRSGAGSGTRSGGAWCCSGSASGTSFDGRTARR